VNKAPSGNGGSDGGLLEGPVLIGILILVIVAVAVVVMFIMRSRD
jgi:hypothetical protein